MVDFLVIKEKHIKARYFFIKDKIEYGEVEVQYFPTEHIWTDILKNPDQGMNFCKDRAALMNVPVNYNDEFERKKTHLLLLSRDK